MGPARRQFHAQRAADQQARIDALLLEAIAALASLLNSRDHPATPRLTRSASRIDTAKTCQNMHTERCRTMCRQRGR